MATAASLTIAQVDEVVPVGDLDPEAIVTPAMLGAGYLVFFLYSTVIGVFAIVLAFVVAARSPRPPTLDEPAPA